MALCSGTERPSIAPEQLLHAMQPQALHSICSERQLMERLEFDLLFKWFVGPGVYDEVWTTRHSHRTATGFCMERSRRSL